MKKFICFLIIISCQVNAGGTQLIPLRESGEADFRVVSKAVHFKGDEPRYSVLVAQEMFNRLHASEEYQVVAAWLQTKWLQNNRGFLGRTEMTARWSLCRKRVEIFIDLLAQAPRTDKSISDIYERCYKKTEFKDRYVPGCGNRPTVLMRPERFAIMMSSYRVTLNS